MFVCILTIIWYAFFVCLSQLCFPFKVFFENFYLCFFTWFLLYDFCCMFCTTAWGLKIDALPQLSSLGKSLKHAIQKVPFYWKETVRSREAPVSICIIFSFILIWCCFSLLIHKDVLWNFNIVLGFFFC